METINLRKKRPIENTKTTDPKRVSCDWSQMVQLFLKDLHTPTNNPQEKLRALTCSAISFFKTEDKKARKLLDTLDRPGQAHYVLLAQYLSNLSLTYLSVRQTRGLYTGPGDLVIRFGLLTTRPCLEEQADILLDQCYHGNVADFLFDKALQNPLQNNNLFLLYSLLLFRKEELRLHPHFLFKALSKDLLPYQNNLQGALLQPLIPLTISEILSSEAYDVSSAFVNLINIPKAYGLAWYQLNHISQETLSLLIDQISLLLQSDKNIRPVYLSAALFLLFDINYPDISPEQKIPLLLQLLQKNEEAFVFFDLTFMLSYLASLDKHYHKNPFALELTRLICNRLPKEHRNENLAFITANKLEQKEVSQDQRLEELKKLQKQAQENKNAPLSEALSALKESVSNTKGSL